MMAVAEAPMHYKDVLNRKDWRKWEWAMDAEYRSIMENKTWKLVARPPGANVIGSRWTYKLKHGGLHKARFVAKGYLLYIDIPPSSMALIICAHPHTSPNCIEPLCNVR